MPFPSLAHGLCHTQTSRSDTKLPRCLDPLSINTAMDPRGGHMMLARPPAEVAGLRYDVERYYREVFAV